MSSKKQVADALAIVEQEFGVKLRRRKLSELKPDPKNLRKHSARNKGMIADSIAEVGAAGSIVTDANDVTRAGNATLEMAPSVGISEGIEIETTGDRLLIHKRGDVTDERKGKRLAIADNAASDASEWDAENIRVEIDHDAAILDGFLSEKEQDVLLERARASVRGDDDREVLFTEELMESHNYVVLYFDNDVDWKAAPQVFELKTVKSKRSKGQFQQRGIGRIVRGAPVVRKLLGAEGHE